ncbi:septum site-determining protein MinC [Alkalimarinus alittae]|uniref:Probable septum site-determining protein MinC n=1 Tax=Alkalimarinus alittae TaxID=2961619 RepID=A0ABY6N4B6_9ALTE|nr:septum site-determining protein MinC [Alkalimarinus alittae]UZE96973.1 septum site-determining protein MinC [Alkalimarinus alittae]
MNSTALSSQASCLQLKGSLLPLTVLELSYFEPSQFSAELAAKTEQAPDFFKNLPVVIGLAKFDGSKGPADFEKIIRICSTFSVKPIAVRGGSETQQIAAKLAGLATLPAQKEKTSPVEAEQAAVHAIEDIVAATETAEIKDATSANSETQDTQPTEKTAQPAEDAEVVEVKSHETRIIYQPVRSGQQVYAQNGDLIVLAQVSAGAEILADGNIHVYGPLRGRALAGVKGNTKARIFCHSLEAELVSIAGQYKISEDLQNGSWKKPAQIHLSDETLTVKALVE